MSLRERQKTPRDRQGEIQIQTLTQSLVRIQAQTWTLKLT